ncbi:hypothetical protein [Erwinia phage FBB1]|nr:hypothetical protein [Erwinia phage FBB1]
MKHSITLDFIADEISKGNNGNDIVIWDDKTTADHGYNLITTIINACGPGGGWPEIKFIGDKEEIIRFLKEVYCTSYDEIDEEMLQEFVSSIEKY